MAGPTGFMPLATPNPAPADRQSKANIVFPISGLAWLFLPKANSQQSAAWVVSELSSGLELNYFNSASAVVRKTNAEAVMCSM